MVKVGCNTPGGEDLSHKEEVIIDFGSGTTKFKRISWNHDEERWQVLREESIAIPHQRCLEESGESLQLSRECIDEGLSQIERGLDILDANCDIMSCIGIATAWARSAKNKDVYFNEIKSHYKVSIVTLTHQQEGAIGFMSAVPFLKGRSPNLDFSKVIVWDIGGGSFQQVAVRSIDQNVTDFSNILNYKNALDANLAPWGSVNFAHNLYRHLEIDNTSRLLVGEEVDRASQYAKELFRSLNSTSIAERIKEPDSKVYAIGEFMNKGFLPFNSFSEQLTLDWAYAIRATFQSQREESLCRFLQTINPSYDCGNLKTIETNLILIIAIMEGLGLNSFLFLPEVSVVGAVDYINGLIARLYEDPDTVG